MTRTFFYALAFCMYGWSCGGKQERLEHVSQEALFRQTSEVEKDESVDQRITVARILVFQRPSPALLALPPKEFHDEESIARVVRSHLQPVRDCVKSSQVMSAQELVLYLEIDQRGKVLGGSSLPQGGLEGLSALSACILPLAKAWVFASRTTPGRTIVSIPLGFAELD